MFRYFIDDNNVGKEEKDSLAARKIIITLLQIVENMIMAASITITMP